jgi:hypothetical protein
MVEQAPTFPESVHELHACVQAELQQTPWVQMPEAQSVASPPQAWPLSRRQLPEPSQELLPTQIPAGLLSSEYIAMFTQVPPGPVHSWQAEQVCTQQRPSVHMSELHSPFPLHVAPGALGLIGQSLSVVLLQPEGQHPSLSRQAVSRPSSTQAV